VKLVQVKIENFRGYRHLTTIDIDNMTVFVGANDAGKSSILEALDIFFNKTAPDLDDACVSGDKAVVRIACVFDNFPGSVIIDATNETTLQNEHLLNPDGLLEIHKIYDCSGSKGKVKEIFACAVHPAAENGNDLLSLTNAKLKDRAKKMGVDLAEVDQTRNAELRKAIWEYLEDLQVVDSEVPLSKETGKAIWEVLSKQMPIFALFRSDRASTDQDAEAQDPLRTAIKAAVWQLEAELNAITDQVRNQVQEVAERTVQKISEIAPNLASQLTPRVTNKNWDTLFNVSLTGDEEIPINKRGSGVRRLILLSFFRAQAEKAAEDEEKNAIIYAIEEPETSQHPNNQRMLLDAFMDLVASQECQILLTTHTPVLARHIDQRYLRYVFQDEDTQSVCPCDDAVIGNIVRTLGVLPDHKVKAFLGVEGRHDISFLRYVSSKLSAEDSSIPDLAAAEQSETLVFIPLGGSSLDLWVDRMNGLNRPQFYMMDRDTQPPAPSKYQNQFDQFIAEGHRAWMTTKKELENYIHYDLIRQGQANYSGTGDDFEDVSLLLAQATHEASGSPVAWDDILSDPEKLKKKEGKAKQRLNNDFASQMTLELLQQCDEANLLVGWLQEIGQTLNAE